MQRHAMILLTLLVVLGLIAPAYAGDSFDDWREDFKERAQSEGIAPDVIASALDAITPDEEVVALDQKQPEKKLSLQRYLENTITPKRIEKAKAMKAKYRAELEDVSQKYGVQPNYIVALWAIESDFGNNKGDFSVVRSLATLAYEGRRAEFFTKELISALRIIEREGMPPGDLSGSWAGAMGDCQFMPSTYLRYAVDANDDGHRDVWNSPTDIFSSIANYLHSIGWNKSQSWGRVVTVPEGFTVGDSKFEHGKTASQWRKDGFKDQKTNKKIARGKEILYAIHPAADADGVYLVSQNFRVLLEWNRSRYFATAVGKLADAIGE